MSAGRVILRRGAGLGLAGATMTLLIAWGLAWLHPEGQWLVASAGDRCYSRDGDPTWLYRRSATFGARGIDRHVAPPGPYLPIETPPWWSRARHAPTADQVRLQQGTQGDRMVTEVAYGWPLPAMRYEYTWRTHPVGFASRLRYFDTVNGGYLLTIPAPADRSMWRNRVHALPMAPLIAPFVLNSLLFAGLLLGAQLATTATRRGLRRRRGLCGECGYDLRGHSAVEARCPECGMRRKRPAASQI